MIWKRTPPTGRDEAGLLDQLLSLAASASGYVRARLELVGLEGKECAAVFVQIFAFLILAAGLLAFGYAFLWIGLIAVVSTCTPFHWGWLVLGAGVLHLIGVMGCLCAAKSKSGRSFFSATLEEFRKDQEWLSRSKQTGNRN